MYKGKSLNARKGESAWEFTAGGEVTAPRTILPVQCGTIIALLPSQLLITIKRFIIRCNLISFMFNFSSRNRFVLWLS